MSAEAFRLIRESVHYKRAGTIDSAWVRYRASNPGEAVKLLTYLDARIRGQSPASPPMATMFGRGFLALLAGIDTEPAPEPIPAPITSFYNGAVLDIAGNADPALLLRAGVSTVCVEMTPANLQDFAIGNRGAGRRWGGLKAYGGFYVSRGRPAEAEMEAVADLALTHALDPLIIDTEAHKADSGGSLAWTEDCFRWLDEYFPGEIINVTFGIHQNPSVVNHAALRKHGVRAVWETYDGSGVTLGVPETVAHVWAQGWKPTHVMLGTKSLATELQWANRLRLSEGTVGDIWLWAADHGPAQEALRAGAKIG